MAAVMVVEAAERTAADMAGVARSAAVEDTAADMRAAIVAVTGGMAVTGIAAMVMAAGDLD
jgi:hypothetical protein